VVYQGIVKGVGSGFVEHLSSAAMRLHEPHLTILLDLPADQVALRKGNIAVASRFDLETVAFHQRLRAAFLARAKNNHKRIKVVDATQSVQVVHSKIVELVTGLLAKRGDGNQS
jgi:dTMP kinase